MPRGTRIAGPRAVKPSFLLSASATAALFGAAVFAAPGLAHAQRGSGDTVNWNSTQTVSRSNPTRSAELGRDTTVDDGIGIRDCNCGDVWRFSAPYTPRSGARNVEFWVGTTADACRNSANRGASGTAQTCWQINAESGVTTQAVGGANNIDVSVPARWLVDPVNGQCTPPGTGRSLTGNLYFTAIFRPPDDSTPYGSYQIDYNLQPPTPPLTISASGLESAARVTWSVTATDSDGGTTGNVSNTVRGFYVMCFPGPPVPDGGTIDAGTSCNGDGFRFDAGTDASMDATDNPGTLPDGGVCTVSGVPAGFDVHDDVQFARYRCSTLLGVGTSTFDVRNLSNGTPYRFAVVTQDTAGNRAMSTVTPCTVPQPVTDFWEYYEGSGESMARPGFCAVSRRGVGTTRGAGVGAFAVLGAGAVGAALWRRSKKRKGEGEGRS